MCIIASPGVLELPGGTLSLLGAMLEGVMFELFLLECGSHSSSRIQAG
jgi:hypothetical protein